MLEWLTKLRKTFTYYPPCIIKNTNKQPDEEVHRVKSRRVLSTGASVPVELGCTTLLARRHVHHQMLCDPHDTEIFVEVPLISTID